MNSCICQWIWIHTHTHTHTHTGSEFVYEFICMWIHARIHMYRLWTYIQIHRSELKTMNSSLKIDQNSVFWILNTEKWIMLYEFALMIYNEFKNHNSDFYNEFICELMYLLENLWFCIISTAVVAQRSFNLASLLLQPLQDKWV